MSAPSRNARTAFAASMLAALMSVTCGGGMSALPSPPTAPSPVEAPPVTPAPATPVNITGNWTGTLESSGFATRSISILAFQTDTCVDGAWRTEPADWVGAISGVANEGAFSGSISFQRPADGPGKCAGVGTFSGEVGTDTIKWTSSGFTGDCAGGLPRSVTITLRRE